MAAPELYESVSAASHGAALIVAIPAAAALVLRCDRPLRPALMAYAVGLVACFGASTACHALAASGLGSRTVDAIDHIAIFLLIAGTYTPIAAALLPPRLKRPTLVAVWLAAGSGVALNVALGPLPPWLATSFYLAMGWGGLWCYAGMRPSMSHARLAPLPIGGGLYSLGAAFHVARMPVLWAGVFGAHELFHVFVIAGAATHYRFILTHVTPKLPGNSPGGAAIERSHDRPAFTGQGVSRARAQGST